MRLSDSKISRYWESDFRTPRFPDIGSPTFERLDTSIIIIYISRSGTREAGSCLFAHKSIRQNRILSGE